jgi:hypothetical protein
MVMKNRRTFLKTLAAASTAAALPRSLAGQQKIVRLNVRGGAIDVHHHFQGPGSGSASRSSR